MSEVEEVTSGSDKAKVVLAIGLVIAGIVAYYWFAKQPIYARVGMILAGAAAGFGVAWTSGPGQRLVAFLKDAVAEAKRVTWPSTRETMQMTLIVFAFSVVAAIVLWAIDKGLEYVIYTLLLGWNK
jgi:preprotein translocase subunit SecE